MLLMEEERLILTPGTFQGGVPATSDEEFPTDILFNTPGIHLVILNVEKSLWDRIRYH